MSQTKRALKITVFCSANVGLAAAITEQASVFAQGLALRGWQLLYGGGQIGLMGHFADEALAAGGVVRGAITESLAAGHEVAHLGLTELVIVKDLFERKKWMMEEADAFVIFPGGFGTLDEALEVITWKALGCHNKPILFVNVDGFWDDQLLTFQKMSEAGMIRTEGLKLFEVARSSREALVILGVVLGVIFGVIFGVIPNKF